MAEILQYPYDYLVIEGFATVTRPDGLHMEFPQDTLTFTQTVTVITTKKQISQSLHLTQSVAVNKRLSLSTSNHMVLASQGAKTKPRAAMNTLQITHAAYKTLPASADNILGLLQSVLVHRGINTRLTLTQAAICHFIKNLTASDTLDLSSAAIGSLDSWRYIAADEPALIQNYDPSKLHIPPNRTQNIPIVFVGTGNSLTFKNVDFGDADKIEHTRISRRTIGEELIVYRDPRWPKTEILKFTILDLDQQEGKAMLGFINENLALQIKFCDWNGVRWLGVITNPETSLIQKDRYQVESGVFELEIEFQGVQTGFVLSESVEDSLELAGSGGGVL